MADGRTYNVEDRIRELGEDPATAYANAKAQGMAGDAPPPTSLEGAPTSLEAAPASLDNPQLGASSAPAMPKGPPLKKQKPDPFEGGGPSIVAGYAPEKDAPGYAASPASPVDAQQLGRGHTGTLGDSSQSDVTPELNPAATITNPIEPEASWGELVGADRHAQLRENFSFDDSKMYQGYAPIVRALGYDDSENPAWFNGLTPDAEARFGSMGSPSRIASEAKAGELVPFSNDSYLADRPLQEGLIVDLIKKHRATDPNFLPGVPDTVAGLHAMFDAQQKQKEGVDNAVLARSPGGLKGFGAGLVGGFEGWVQDPVNLAQLAIPGGAGKKFVQVVAREALVNGILTALQQPIVAHNRAELGDDYTARDAVTNIASGAGFGAVLGTAGHYAAEGAKAGVAALRTPVHPLDAAFTGTTGDFIKTLPQEIRGKWAGRVDGRQPVSEFFNSLSNHDIVELANDASGGKLSPDAKAAANVVTRAQDIGESSPFQPGPVGDNAHDGTLGGAMKDHEDHRIPETPEFPSGSSVNGADAAAPAAAPERPPASSTAGRPQRFQLRPDSEVNAIDSFVDRVATPESHGDVNAKNPKSSASGKWQFTDGTFRDYYRKVYGEDLGEHPPANIKNDPAIQRHLMATLTRDNADRLKSLGETVNHGNLYVMHFLGEGDGAKLFKADPATPIEDLVHPKVIEANPFLRGKSASEVIAWAHGRMGVHVSSVRAGAGALEPATDDGRTPLLNDEALHNDGAVIASNEPTSDWGTKADDLASETEAAPLQPPRSYVQTINNGDIGVDAERFQFKSGGDEQGVTPKLRSVGAWNDYLSGMVTAWQDNAGKFWIADGHQRLGLSHRISEATGEQIPLTARVFREADGVTAEDARTWAAIKNIGDQDGKHPTGEQLVDAAKVARGAGVDVLRRALPPTDALVRDGEALARLSDPAFGAVVNDVVPADFAAVIGHLLPHRPEAHEAMIELLQKLDPANRGQATSIVRQAIAAGIHKEEQIDLFGTHEHVTTLMLEKAKIIEKVLGELRKMKLVHKTAAEGADALERTGSKIAKSASEKEAKANAQAIETVNRLAYRAGPIADAVNAAAAALKSGGKLAALARTAAEHIRELDLAALDRESAGDAAAGGQSAGDGEPGAESGSAGAATESPIPGEIGADEGGSGELDAGGRGGQAGEALPSLPAERGDPEQPGLLELEQATERFSDPDGAGVQGQAQSLVHDLKAEVLTRRERIQRATAALEGRGEFRTVEPFAEEPGYHRFRYVSADGEAVTGNYTVDGNTIEGFNIGDTHNPKALGPKEMRSLFEQLAEQHPGTKYVHGYRMSGARTETGGGEAEVWFELGEKGIKRLDGPPADANGPPARETDAGGTRQPEAPARAENASNELLKSDQGPDPAIAERNRQAAALEAKAPLRAPGDVDQLGEIGLPLMDSADQPTFRLGEDGEEITADDLLKDLEDDDKAIKAIKDCL